MASNNNHNSFPDPATELDLAQGMVRVNQTAIEARNRLVAKLEQDQGPSVAAATSRWIDWGSMSDFLGQPFDSTRIPLSKLEQMRRDPMIAFGLYFVKVFLARAPWRIISTDAQRASFIDGSLREIYARYILQRGNCLDYGYSAVVKRFQRSRPDWEYIDKANPDTPTPLPTWNFDVDALTWKPFMALPPRRVSPAWTKDGDFNGIRLRPGGLSEAIFIPNANTIPEIGLDWSLWATNEKDTVFGSLWGYPRTGYAYRYWWAYWYRFGLADRAFEKWADPPVMAYHPSEIVLDPDTGERIDFTQSALSLAESLRSGANVAMPADVVTSLDDRVTNVRTWSLEQLQTTTDFTALDEAFKYLDVAKLRAMMIPEQAFLEGRGGTSSRNVARTLGDVFEEAQALLKAEIDDEINRYLIPQLLEVNFGPGGPTCRIETTGFDARDVETMRAIVQTTAQFAPIRLADIDFRDLLGSLGIPLIPYAAQKDAEDKLIKQIQEMKPQPMEAKSGTGGNAGVNTKGLYYNPRELIDLSQRLHEIGTAMVEEDKKYEDQKKEIIDTIYSGLSEAERRQSLQLEEEIERTKIGMFETLSSGLSNGLADIAIKVKDMIKESPPPKVEAANLSEESLGALSKMLSKVRKRKTKKIVRDDFGDIAEIIETEEEE